MFLLVWLFGVARFVVVSAPPFLMCFSCQLLSYKSGKIEFRLGEKGVLEDISITGLIDSNSRKFMNFLMGKFTNIDMPGIDGVALESYHTIYFYTIDIKDYFPAAMRNYVDKDFFIAAIPKSQMIELMNAQKKNIRKYIRKLLTL